MAKTHFEPSIISRPVYGEFEARTAPAYLFVANAEGAEAVLDLAKSAGPDVWPNAIVLYVPGRCENKHLDALEALGAKQFYVGPTIEALLGRLARNLQDLRMGAQVYLSGTEGLMGQAMRACTDAGLPHTFIQSEHRGSLARRMQCVHCKGITEEVTTDPFVCSHCGLNLFVRDHYSRRLAAFQGVCIDAEDPGNVPAAEELYP